ncbi:MAG: dNTP triphosphohydrolase [Bacteroidetes bacterium]|nr:dNTP triphosphohydrolase [Bacteroidota bacterium]
MQWEKLFSSRRLGQSDSNEIAQLRPGFHRDFDRIVFSTAFRHLQNKTQVVPLPETDFVHTRLTHSLETSCVGRSLGRMVGKIIIERQPELNTKFNITEDDFGTVVATACLAHDIGNPPFGHSGEDAISDFFRGDKAIDFITGLPENFIAELQNFEGNAAGFRLLTNTNADKSAHSGGLNLTAAVLGAFTKYPKGVTPNATSKKASEKKYGFFASDKENFKEVATATGLITNGDYQWKRHSLAFLMEAADDICYHIIDLEDGTKLGWVAQEEAEELLGANTLDKKDKTKLQNIFSSDERVGYLRAKIINQLVDETATAFIQNIDGILSGDFDESLTKNIPSQRQMKEIQKISLEKIYRHPSVLQIEAAGFEVLGGLLQIFLDALLGKPTQRREKIKMLLPNYSILNGDMQNPEIMQQQIHLVVEFIAGMTDRTAISLYRKISGISLPY